MVWLPTAYCTDKLSLREGSLNAEMHWVIHEKNVKIKYLQIFEHNKSPKIDSQLSMVEDQKY